MMSSEINGEIDAVKYQTISSDTLIYDHFSYYTTADHNETIGGDDPEKVVVGDQFTLYEYSPRFNSDSGQDEGYSITDMDLEVVSVEAHSVPAGDFEALKVRFSGTLTVFSITQYYHFVFTGSVWYDVDNGYKLEMITEGSLTSLLDNVELFTSSAQVLQTHNVTNTDRKRKSSLSSGLKVTPNRMFDSIVSQIGAAAKGISSSIADHH